MSQEHDAFLESQCAQEEAQGRVPSVIRLIAALREHAPMGLKQGKEMIEDFLARREQPTAEQSVMLNPNVGLFEQFLTHKEAGRKQEAQTALNAFLACFQTPEAKIAWVKEYLERGRYGHRMRHELYKQLIFPVLLEGYKRQDAWSLYWLAGTAQNLYANRALHAQLNWKTELQFLQEVYDIAPTEEIKQRLLRAILSWLNYCQHEWPAGILYGADGANLDECEDILQEAALAKRLDSGDNAAFLQEFESKVQEYRQRLRNKQSGKGVSA